MQSGRFFRQESRAIGIVLNGAKKNDAAAAGAVPTPTESGVVLLHIVGVRVTGPGKAMVQRGRTIVKAGAKTTNQS